MLQLAHHSKSGAVELVEVPDPVLGPRCVLVRTLASVVSGGTERNTVQVSRANMIQTAIRRPDLVRRLMSKFRKDGLAATARVVQDRIERTTALGYSSAGVVLLVGDEVDDIQAGDVVACMGQGFASHAQVVAVPRRLVARVPDGVEPDEAAFGTMGAIALQGVRLGRVELGANVAVIGLGLVGQITVQLLAAAGCRILATDLAEDRVKQAARHGAEMALTAASLESGNAERDFTRNRGFDCVFVTADSSSSAPLELAAQLARDKGRVVLVGLVKTEFPREQFYRKELELVVSRSTGPGRYDPEFEEEGVDYPYAYIRWTETRNLEAFLDLLAAGKIAVSHLISHRFAFDKAPEAYRLLASGESQMGIVFDYPRESAPARSVEIARTKPPISSAKVDSVGWIGCGSFARSVLIPAARDTGLRLAAVASEHGLSARSAAEKFGFETVCSSPEDVFARDDVGAVFITSPHATHADLVCRALRAGKHVFVEKPLAIRRDEVEEISRALNESDAMLMVGFNRRFSPFAAEARKALAGAGPFSFHYRVNAGRVPADHWVRDPAHGGRMVGEVCHFVDLITFLAAGRLEQVFAFSPRFDVAGGVEDIQMSLRFSDGTAGVITYLTSNDAPISKEHLQIWASNQVIDLDDFEQAWFYKDGKERNLRWRRRAKGHPEEVAAFHKTMRRGGEPPIAFDDLARTTIATIEALKCLETGVPYCFDAESPAFGPPASQSED
ncbi:MAG: bi-domain-containing oxidoreductase [Acidobacteria bacterium]|nr:bi-domain-containing oxidoreductase [Acidobacteriota bacterium]